MAYAIVQNTNNASGTAAVTATFSSTPTTGNLLLCFVHDLTTSTPALTVKDGNNNSFTQLASNVILSGAHSVFVFGLIATASQSSTVTAQDGTHTVNINIYEVSGNPSSLTGIVDVSAATNGSGTTTSGSQPSITTTNANDLVLSSLVLAGTVTAPSITGGTLLQATPSGAIELVDGYQIETSTGTYNPSFSWTSSHSWNQITLALKPGSSGTTYTQSLSGGLSYSGSLGTNIEPAAPTLTSPANAGSVSTTTPVLDFSTTDLNSDAVSYEVQVNTSSTFGSTVDSYAFSNIDSTYGFGFGNTRESVGQSFTGNGGAISYAIVSLDTNGVSSSGTVRAQIFAETDSVNFGTDSIPTGTALANSNTVNVSSIPTTATQITFTFPTPYTTTNGTHYVLVIDGSSITGTSSLINIGRDITSPTATGNSSTLNSGTWGADNTTDLPFIVGSQALIDAFSTSGGHDTAQFADVTHSADTDPFPSGDSMSFTIPSGEALTTGNTYYWRVRAKDPSGTNAWSNWSSTYSFTVSSGGTTYTQSLTAGLSPSGAYVRQTARPISAALSFAGAIGKFPLKALQAAQSFSGSISRALNRSLTASLSFSTVFTYLAEVVMTATLTTAGNMVHLPKKALTASLTSSGSVSRVVSRPLTAALGLVGSFAKSTSRAFTAGLSSAGSFAKLPKKALTAGISYSTVFIYQADVIMTAGLNFAGSVVRSTSHGLSGSLSFAGSVVKLIQRSISSALSFTGNTTGVKIATKVLSGALSFSGSAARTTGKVLNAGVSFTGSMGRAISYIMNSGLSFAGSTAKMTIRSFTGAVSFAGSIARRIMRPLTAVLSYSTVFLFQANAIMTATLTFAGSTTKFTSRSISAALSFIGGFATQHISTLAQNFTAALSFTGNTVKQTPKSFIGVLNFDGNFLKQVVKVLRAGVSFVGAHSRLHIIPKILTASLSFSGGIGKGINKIFTSALTFSVNQARDFIAAFLKPINIAFILVESLLFTMKIPEALSFTMSQPIALNTNVTVPGPLDFSVTIPSSVLEAIISVSAISVTVIVPAPIDFVVSK